MRYMLVRRVNPDPKGKPVSSPSGHPYRIIKVSDLDALSEIWADPHNRFVGSYHSAKAAREAQADQIRATIANVQKYYLIKELRNA